MSREVGEVLGSSLGEVKEVDVGVNGNCWDSDGSLWRFTGFYGDPISANRIHSWSLIRRLAGLSNLPWLIGGDFNEILRWEDKTGGIVRSHTAISLFCGVVDDCNLVDLGFRGHDFTWSNRQMGDKLIQERLDRYLCCMRWRATFPNAVNVHLDWGGSDHKPILMENIRVASAMNHKVPNWTSRFHFEEAWVGEPDCKAVVENAWFVTPSIDGVAGLASSTKSKPEEVERRVTDYFSGLFSSSCPTAMMIDNVIQAVDSRVSADMNQTLMGVFTASEIQQALKQMAPSKAPGPDGLPALFYQSFWGVVGDKVTQALLAVLNNGADMREMSRAVVALIPKVKSPIRTSDFRPISLCNVSYKLVAKVLANRLKLILNDVIAPSQSAFVPGRLITDNVVVGFECLHYLNNRRLGSKGLAALKLDMSKAYDRVEWAASGQAINFEKSALTFSPNTSAGTISTVRNIFRVDVVSSHDKYLGLPSSVGRNKKGIFGSILDRVWNKLQGWKGRLFSIGGKEVLIKAIAQAVLAYAMSCFKLPVSIGLEVQKMGANFWWGSGQDKRKMHWFSWKRLCQPKVEGGMGFRDFQAFNQAMLAKQGWRILNDPSSLLSRVLKAKYFPNTNFLKSSLGWKPFFVWRSILWGRDVLLRGLRWKVGDGQSISVYDDPWIPRDSNFKVYSPRLLPDGTPISALIGAPGVWSRDLVQFYFRPEKAATILSIPLCSSPLSDTPSWHFDKLGCFSVKSAYRLALNANNSASPSSSRTPPPWWKKLWSLPLPSKIKIFCWRACKEALPTKAGLFKRGIGDSILCPFCSRLPESSDHALWGCKARSSYWKECPFFSELSSFPAVDFFDRIAWVSSSCSLKQLLVFVVGSWFAWSSRNLILHNSSPSSFSDFWSGAACFVDSLLVPTQVPLQGEVVGRAVPRWSPPSSGFKINVDAAVDAASGRFGVGFVIRNHQGRLKAASSLVFRDFFSVVAAEAKAVLEGFRLTVASCFFPFCVESDFLQVVNLCSGISSSRCEEDSVIQDILSQFGSLVSSISFISRSCNFVAHSLAKWAIGVSLNSAWSCSFPDWLLKLVKDDFCCVAP
ncbi:hypothetical protein ACOSQ4_016258 [Xanthoceras sorbifolium]